VLEMPDDGRFSEFTHQLHHFRPHLVYLSGHGNFIKDYLNHTDRGYFLFESDNDGGELVDEEQLAAAFTGTTVQAVILSACEFTGWPAKSIWRKSCRHLNSLPRKSAYREASMAGSSCRSRWVRANKKAVPTH